jgi:hypothetical protein
MKSGHDRRGGRSAAAGEPGIFSHSQVHHRGPRPWSLNAGRYPNWRPARLCQSVPLFEGCWLHYNGPGSSGYGVKRTAMLMPETAMLMGGRWAAGVQDLWWQKNSIFPTGCSI